VVARWKLFADFLPERLPMAGPTSFRCLGRGLAATPQGAPGPVLVAAERDISIDQIRYDFNPRKRSVNFAAPCAPLIRAGGIRCENRVHFIALCSQIIRRRLTESKYSPSTKALQSLSKMDGRKAG